jgi:hypothetical protein
MGKAIHGKLEKAIGLQRKPPLLSCLWTSLGRGYLKHVSKRLPKHKNIAPHIIKYCSARITGKTQHS